MAMLCCASYCLLYTMQTNVESSSIKTLFGDYFDEIERMIKLNLFKRDLFYIASGLK